MLFKFYWWSSLICRKKCRHLALYRPYAEEFDFYYEAHRFCQRFADLVKDKQLNRKLCRFSFYLNFSEGWTVHLKVQITCFHMWRSRLLVSSDDYLKFSSLKVLRILFQNPKADKNGRGEGCRAGAGGGLRVLQGWGWWQEGGAGGNRQASRFLA